MKTEKKVFETEWEFVAYDNECFVGRDAANFIVKIEHGSQWDHVSQLPRPVFNHALSLIRAEKARERPLGEMELWRSFQGTTWRSEIVRADRFGLYDRAGNLWTLSGCNEALGSFSHRLAIHKKLYQFAPNEARDPETGLIVDMRPDQIRMPDGRPEVMVIKNADFFGLCAAAGGWVVCAERDLQPFISSHPCHDTTQLARAKAFWEANRQPYVDIETLNKRVTELQKQLEETMRELDAIRKGINHQ